MARKRHKRGNNINPLRKLTVDTDTYPPIRQLVANQEEIKLSGYPTERNPARISDAIRFVCASMNLVSRKVKQHSIDGLLAFEQINTATYRETFDDS